MPTPARAPPKPTPPVVFLDLPFGAAVGDVTIHGDVTGADGWFADAKPWRAPASARAG